MKNKVRYAVVGLGRIAQTAVLPAFRHAERYLPGRIAGVGAIIPAAD
jgi:predicted dehydrogenase